MNGVPSASHALKFCASFCEGSKYFGTEYGQEVSIGSLAMGSIALNHR